MFNSVGRIIRCEKGATAIEYGLIASLVVTAIMVAVSNLGGSTSEMWNYVSYEIITSTGS